MLVRTHVLNAIYERAEVRCSCSTGGSDTVGPISTVWVLLSVETFDNNVTLGTICYVFVYAGHDALSKRSEARPKRT